MNKIYCLGWYTLVLLDIIFLLFSIFKQDLLLAVCGLVLGIQLKRTQDKVSLPNIYKRLQVNSIFIHRKQ